MCGAAQQVVPADEHPCVLTGHFALALKHLRFVQLYGRVFAAELSVRWTARGGNEELRPLQPRHCR